ncbi:MAG: hypothetical protein ACYTG1_00450 [Planctomycetota bacterium]
MTGRTGTDRGDRPARVARRVWLVALLAVLASVGVLVVLMLLSGRRAPDWVTRGAAVASVATIPTLLGFLASVVMVRGELRGFMWLAMALIVVSLVGWMHLTWRAGAMGPIDAVDAARVLVTTTLVGGGLAVFGLLATGPTRRPLHEAVRGVVIGAGLLASAALVLLLWSRLAERALLPVGLTLAGATALAVLAGVADLALGRLDVARRRRIGDSVPRQVTVELACPECGEERTAPSGLSRCPECGTALLIEVEEPRCECGYLLYRLAGETCPECGRPVDPTRRWASERHDPAAPPAS